jgi:hypothetical protein
MLSVMQCFCVKKCLACGMRYIDAHFDIYLDATAAM